MSGQESSAEDAIRAAEHVAEAMIELWRRAHEEVAAAVSDQQMRALLVLEGGGGNPTALAARLGLSPSSTTRLYDRLEHRGLVARVQSGRRVAVSLTALGSRLLEETRRCRRELLRQALSAAAVSDRQVLHEALEQLCALVRGLPAAAPEQTVADPDPRCPP
ncbi:MarR family transcriptional regulator [Kitasatospora sp. NA04385]|uniref:MarR family winged helix-turn-helix transcriptional regulator n=1 Tax=Kitasatospora sp. NA04385 TaxID=2742135 RepID=UPI001590BB87|nr:MarR family transcriptional regulator [Kitasatospora sp. NA04385]QKW18078.1 MarR family transcriptional regulator [Kitasatospora sp. NA04385]